MRKSKKNEKNATEGSNCACKQSEPISLAPVYEVCVRGPVRETEKGGINWQSNMQFTEVFKMSGQKSWWSDRTGANLPSGIYDSDWCPVLQKDKQQLDNLYSSTFDRAYLPAVEAHLRTRCQWKHRYPALSCPAQSCCLCRLLDRKSRLGPDFDSDCYSRHHSLAALRAVCCQSSGNCCKHM